MRDTGRYCTLSRCFIIIYIFGFWDAIEFLFRFVGNGRELFWRGKFTTVEDAVMTFVIDDGNRDRARRNALLDARYQFAGVSYGKDNDDHYLIVVLLESFNER